MKQDPDIANSSSETYSKLDLAGMSEVEVLSRVQTSAANELLIPARADAFVNLIAPKRGIHMSRLFLILTKALNESPLSPYLLAQVAKDFTRSHDGLSDVAKIDIRFQLPLMRPSLLSGNQGWRFYDVGLGVHQSSSSVDLSFDLKIAYSSTCPCSAALARELIQQKFMRDFNSEMVRVDQVHQWLSKEESIAGTPHGQRSHGILKARLKEPQKNLEFIVKAVDAMELSLGTPVQTAVKREDEQEFARLNAKNLMFAEDAARRMRDSLKTLGIFKSFSVEARHFESLHPHDAVSVASFE